jgi:hypothetical protein
MAAKAVEGPLECSLGAQGVAVTAEVVQVAVAREVAVTVTVAWVVAAMAAVT